MSADEEWIDELAGEAEVGAKPHNVLPLIPGRAQLQATLNAPILSDYQRLALRTLYRSGIRPRELSQIELLADGSIRVGPRLVAIDPETFRALTQLPALFPESQGELYAWLTTAANSSGLLDRCHGMGRKLSANLLRHSFACHQLEQGMDLISLFHLLGHQHFWSTSIYKQTAVGLLRTEYQTAHPLSDAPNLSRRPSRLLRELPDEDEIRERPQTKLSCDEVFSLIQSARDELELLAIRTLYATGLRRFELPAVRYADLDATESRLFVRQGKDSIDRYVLLDAGTAACLLQQQGSKGMADPIFDLTPQGVARAVAYAAECSGLLAKYAPTGMAVSTHALRHAFASHTYARTMQLYTVQQLLGHSSLNNTLIYVNCTLEQQANQYGQAHELSRT